MPTKSVSESKGLKVRIYLWPLDTYADFTSLHARLWMRGDVENEQTGVKKKFNNAGELLTTLGEWNAAQLRAVRKKQKKAATKAT